MSAMQEISTKLHGVTSHTMALFSHYSENFKSRIMNMQHNRLESTFASPTAS
jgi:hypothetical protein